MVKEWHKRLARIVGLLSLRIETRHLSRVELIEWADSLEALARDMRNVADGKKMRREK